MTSTIAVLTSTAGLGVIVFVLGVIKGWVKLGSALVGVIIGTLLGTALSTQLRGLIQGGISSGADWLHHLVGSVTVLGVRPATWMPSWGWKVLTVSLAIILISSVVLFLDGGRSKKKTSS